MARAIATIMAVLFFASAQAKAGAPACDAALSNASPFYCQLEHVDAVRLQLQGSAATLGAHRPDLEQIMRQRMDRFVTDLSKPVAAEMPPLIAKRRHHGQLFCTLWTVGQSESVAMFVECALQSATTGDNVEARLLGRTIEAEFDMASRVALGQVVSRVIARYESQRSQRIARWANQRIKTAGPAR